MHFNIVRNHQSGQSDTNHLLHNILPFDITTYDKLRVERAKQLFPAEQKREFHLTTPYLMKNDRLQRLISWKITIHTPAPHLLLSPYEVASFRATIFSIPQALRTETETDLPSAKAAWSSLPT
jgi:hypothetical protein